MAAAAAAAVVVASRKKKREQEVLKVAKTALHTAMAEGLSPLEQVASTVQSATDAARSSSMKQGEIFEAVKKVALLACRESELNASGVQTAEVVLAVHGTVKKKQPDAVRQAVLAIGMVKVRRLSTQLDRLQRSMPRLPWQDKVSEMYSHPWSQMLVAFLIVLNFCTTVAEKEVDPPFGNRYAAVWQTFEDLFNVVFLLELLVNFYGSFPCEFWQSGWNIFDFIVVGVGTFSLCRVELPPEAALLRTLRAFRVFRLFKRVKSLNKIINSILRAIPGVAQAFVIMIIIMCIYAIVAVEWFAFFGDRGSYTTYSMYTNRSFSADSHTSRGLLYGEEYYGSFSRALYTLWQVLTGESWSEVVARPLLFGYEAPARMSGLKVGFFFTSFLVVMQIVLINVVVAILLEKMVEEEPSSVDLLDEECEEDAVQWPDSPRTGMRSPTLKFMSHNFTNFSRTISLQSGESLAEEQQAERQGTNFSRTLSPLSGESQPGEQQAERQPTNFTDFLRTVSKGSVESQAEEQQAERQPEDVDADASLEPCRASGTEGGKRQRIRSQIDCLQESVTCLHDRMDHLEDLDSRAKSVQALLEVLVAVSGKKEKL